MWQSYNYLTIISEVMAVWRLHLPWKEHTCLIIVDGRVTSTHRLHLWCTAFITTKGYTGFVKVKKVTFSMSLRNFPWQVMGEWRYGLFMFNFFNRRMWVVISHYDHFSTRVQPLYSLIYCSAYSTTNNMKRSSSSEANISSSVNKLFDFDVSVTVHHIYK